MANQNEAGPAQESTQPSTQHRETLLREIVRGVLTDLNAGAGDKDKRRQAEEWMKSLADKYPEFQIETGLRDYYLAEAQRIGQDFAKAADLGEKLALGRQVETFLDRAAEYERRLSER